MQDGGGIVVTFQVTDAEQFLDCRFANFIWLPESQILNELTVRVPLFEGRVSTSGEMADRIDRALEGILREHGVIAKVDHGYFQGSMRAPISAEVFTAHGPSLPVREVVFTDNRAVDSGTLAKTVQRCSGTITMRSSNSSSSRETLPTPFVSAAICASRLASRRRHSSQGARAVRYALRFP
jgi:hypothetical protein